MYCVLFGCISVGLVQTAMEMVVVAGQETIQTQSKDDKYIYYESQIKQKQLHKLNHQIQTIHKCFHDDIVDLHKADVRR